MNNREFHNIPGDYSSFQNENEREKYVRSETRHVLLDVLSKFGFNEKVTKLINFYCILHFIIKWEPLWKI
jgi:hypothetical protein